MDGHPGKAKYVAFISYSHSDEAAGNDSARWLHRYLERYRIPKDTASDYGVSDFLGRRLGKVFRDREELGAGNVLKEDIQAALRSSGALVVMCSPAAARSKYVAAEIEYFLAEVKDARLIPVIIEGDPSDAYPPNLAARGDLTGADFRAGKDGRESGALKVIAGLLSVGKDDLVQRERRAQRMRLHLALGAVAVFAVTAIAAMWLGFAARNNGLKAQANEKVAIAAARDAKANAAKAEENAEEANRQATAAEAARQQASRESQRALLSAHRASALLDAGKSQACSTVCRSSLALLMDGEFQAAARGLLAVPQIQRSDYETKLLTVAVARLPGTDIHAQIEDAIAGARENTGLLSPLFTWNSRVYLKLAPKHYVALPDSALSVAYVRETDEIFLVSERGRIRVLDAFSLKEKRTVTTTQRVPYGNPGILFADGSIAYYAPGDDPELGDLFEYFGARGDSAEQQMEPMFGRARSIPQRKCAGLRKAANTQAWREDRCSGFLVGFNDIIAFRDAEHDAALKSLPALPPIRTLRELSLRPPSSSRLSVSDPRYTAWEPPASNDLKTFALGWREPREDYGVVTISNSGYTVGDFTENTHMLSPLRGDAGGAYLAYRGWYGDALPIGRICVPLSDRTVCVQANSSEYNDHQGVSFSSDNRFGILSGTRDERSSSLYLVDIAAKTVAAPDSSPWSAAPLFITDGNSLTIFGAAGEVWSYSLPTQGSPIKEAPVRSEVGDQLGRDRPWRPTEMMHVRKRATLTPLISCMEISEVSGDSEQPRLRKVCNENLVRRLHPIGADRMVVELRDNRLVSLDWKRLQLLWATEVGLFSTGSDCVTDVGEEFVSVVCGAILTVLDTKSGLRLYREERPGPVTVGNLAKLEFKDSNGSAFALPRLELDGAAIQTAAYNLTALDPATGASYRLVPGAKPIPPTAPN